MGDPAGIKPEVASQMAAQVEIDRVKEDEKCHLRGFLPRLEPSCELLLKLVLDGDWIF